MTVDKLSNHSYRSAVDAFITRIVYCFQSELSFRVVDLKQERVLLISLYFDDLRDHDDALGPFLDVIRLFFEPNESTSTVTIAVVPALVHFDHAR